VAEPSREQLDASAASLPTLSLLKRPGNAAASGVYAR
jgi:hypothetical protein